MRPAGKFAPGFWLRLLLILPVAAYASIIILGAIALTAMVTLPLPASVCCQSPRDFGAQYDSVHFPGADGAQLSGWYVPGRNGVVIILLHSYYADRRQTLPVAAMLARHGYGLLMYDQRAGGESEGQVRSLGWLDIPDLDQAVAYLQSRGETRIGAYGCSVGGGIALAAAAGNPAIAAVAADAPNPLSFDEIYTPAGDAAWVVDLPLYMLYYRLVVLRAGSEPPMSTAQAVARIAPRRLLLISTGQGGEQARTQALFAAAGQPKEQWNIPINGHCAGPLNDPAGYERHLVEFFDQAFLH